MIQNIGWEFGEGGVVLFFIFNENSFGDCVSADQISQNSPASSGIATKNKNSFILLGVDQDQKQESGI